MDNKLKEIQDQINEYKKSGSSVGELSDTYHSFNDLYEHRVVLDRKSTHLNSSHTS